MNSAITQPRIMQALGQGACGPDEILRRLNLDPSVLATQVLRKFHEMCHLLEKAGVIVYHTTEDGELLYCLCLRTQMMMAPEDRALLERIAEAVEQGVNAYKGQLG